MFGCSKIRISSGPQNVSLSITPGKKTIVMYDKMSDCTKSVLNDSLSGFLKVHSSATAILEMTEDFSGQ